MKTIFYFLILICLPLFAEGQPPIRWENSYGGSQLDFANTITTAVNSGYIFGGSTNSTDGNVINPGFGNDDFWLVRLDSSGNIIWENSYGGSGYDQIESMVSTNINYTAAGNTGSSDGEITGYHGGGDIWVIQTDSAGNLLWEHAYGGSLYENEPSLQLTKDGNYIFSATTNSTDGDITYYHGGYCDYWVVKVNDTGKILWQKTYGGSLGDACLQILPTKDSGYIVAGYTTSSDGDVTINHGGVDAWLVKINDTGAIMWQQTYGGSNADAAYAIQQTPDGGYIVAAATQSTDGEVTGYRGGYSDDIWVFKIDSIGNLQWEKTYGGTDRDEPVSITSTTDSGYIFTGYTLSHDGDVTGLHGDTTDYWVVKINDTGAIQWEKTYGGTGEDKTTSFLYINDTTYIVAGYSDSNDGDVTGNHGKDDGWLISFGSISPNSISQVKPSKLIQVYPTLTHGIINVIIPNVNDKINIQLINMLGQPISVEQTTIGDDYILNLLDSDCGMYILQIQDETAITNYKIVYEYKP